MTLHTALAIGREQAHPEKAVAACALGAGAAWPAGGGSGSVAIMVHDRRPSSALGATEPIKGVEAPGVRLAPVTDARRARAA